MRYLLRWNLCFFPSLHSYSPLGEGNKNRCPALTCKHRQEMRKWVLVDSVRYVHIAPDFRAKIDEKCQNIDYRRYDIVQ